jgi:N6-L-threonylcarbamoyladenine synthase
MIVLGIESSCDETGVALCTGKGKLLAQALHSQVAMHQDYGGVVPELASRDHIRRVLPLTQLVLNEAKLSIKNIDAIAYTQGPGLAGALLVGAGVAASLAWALEKPLIGVHHLEGHLLAPLLSSKPPQFPFIALLVSGGHTQLMHVKALGEYEMLGETVDDAAGEAFDKSAKLLGLGYPGGPALSKLAESGDEAMAKAFNLPRPMLHSGNLDFSFAGLKTAVFTQVKAGRAETLESKAALARAAEEAIVEVLSRKALSALKATGLKRLVCAGGVAANRKLRVVLNEAAAKNSLEVFYPELSLCTDNGAMIALAGALRLAANPALAQRDYAFSVKPRWPLDELQTSATSKTNS